MYFPTQLKIVTLCYYDIRLNDNSVVPNSEVRAATSVILFKVLNTKLRRNIEGRMLRAVLVRDSRKAAEVNKNT
jgi:hypothetical protein